MTQVFAMLRALLGSRVAASGLARLDAELAGDAPLEPEAFLLAFASAGRWVGRTSLAPAAQDLVALRAAGIAWPIRGWRLDDVARILLLLRAAAAEPGAGLETLVAQSYARGDTDERRAVLRALALLPAPERFVPLAVEACRTNVQPLFEAIACENPYPAAHFAPAGFNQMVLKALFVGVALERVVGLAERDTPELRRMAADYASERRAAGRSVPADVERLTSGGPWR